MEKATTPLSFPRVHCHSGDNKEKESMEKLVRNHSSKSHSHDNYKEKISLENIIANFLKVHDLKKKEFMKDNVGDKIVNT